MEYKVEFDHTYITITPKGINLFYWDNDKHATDGKTFQTLSELKTYTPTIPDGFLRSIFEGGIQRIESFFAAMAAVNR